MCGIWVSAGKLINDEQAVASRALELVHHRGPNGFGIWASEGPPPVVIGHRRLAIIDPDVRSNQPMKSSNDRYILTLNGEIYNHGEIRKALVADGCALETTSDTEVLLEGLARWGLPLLHQLRGFFAFVLFDKRERRLVAARDRYGIKPLYYLSGAQYIAFASEIKQFRGLAEFKRQLNNQALIDYLAFGLFDHSDFTFFEGVQQVEPGHVVRVSLDTIKAPRIERFAWASPLCGVAGDGNKGRNSLRDALRTAVSLGLTSDVPVGIALSGGLDSSVVASTAAAMQQSRYSRLQAVGLFFDQPEIDESGYARSVAEKVNLDLRTATVAPDELEELFRATIWSFDEPIARASMLAQMKLYRVFEAIGIKVVLSGQGGDEIFCGYASIWPALLLDILRSNGLGSFFRTTRSSLVSAREFWTEIAPVGWIEDSFLRAMDKPGWFDAVLSRSFDQDVARCRVERGRLRQPSPVLMSRAARSSERLLRAAHLPMLLHYDDRAGMAAGVESRPVLLDPDLVAVAQGLSPELRTDRGLLKGALRTAINNDLPPAVVDRTKKLGFPVPEAFWLTGNFGDFLIERAKVGLEMFSSSLSQIADVDELQRRLSGRRFQGTPTWALASLGEWGTQF